MKLYELIEGRNDPHTHKAVFMLGGPGSGKTYVAQKITGGTGLRSINVDEFYEMLRGQHGKGFDPELYKYSGNLTQKKFNLLIRGRLGLVIDGTGRKIDRLSQIKDQLEKLGYDTMAVFVNTELNTALDRNDMRVRRADSNWVRQVHAELKSKLGGLQQIFGNNMLIVDNTEDREDFTDAQKTITKFLNAPNARPVSWPVEEAITTVKPGFKAYNDLDNDPDENDWVSPKEQAAKSKKADDRYKLIGQDAEDINSDLIGGDEAEYYKRVTMKIMRDAKDFIGKSGEPLKLAYRGYERFDNLPFHRPYRQNRQPKDSSNTDQQTFNAAIRSAGGVADRSNSIFVSGNLVQARKYGEVYVVFPIGDFNYTYHDTTADWYDQYGSRPQGKMKNFLELIVGKDPTQVAYSILRTAEEEGDVVDVGQAGRSAHLAEPYKNTLPNAANAFLEIADGIHADENLRAGLGKGVEILLSAKGGYYYVPEHYFFKYVARYMEHNGIKVELRQKTS